jgi:hypothetical protein
VWCSGLRSAMAELHHSATWDARIREIETIHPRGAAWLAEALELGERAVRERNGQEAVNAQRLAEQRERFRTSEELLESLAKRLIAASTALEQEKERREEADRRAERMQASLSGASEAAQISADAAAAGRQALRVAMVRAETAEQQQREAQEQARVAATAAVEAANRAQNLAVHVQAVERRHAELLGADPGLHADLRSPRAAFSPHPEPEPEPEPEPLQLAPASPDWSMGSSSSSSRSRSPSRSARRSPRRAKPAAGIHSPTASSINQRSTPRRSSSSPNGRQHAKPVDGVPRFGTAQPHEDTPGVGSYEVYTQHTIAASAAAARDTGRHRRHVSPHKPVRPSRKTALGTDTAGAAAPHTVGHAQGLAGAKPVNRAAQRCTFNG